jgi:hypothetical protein
MIGAGRRAVAANADEVTKPRNGRIALVQDLDVRRRRQSPGLQLGADLSEQ